MLRLSGPKALNAASKFIRWHHRGLSPRTAVLADAYDGAQQVDRVLITFFPGPHSYSGEDLIEISAHGSPFILKTLLESAVRAGARLAEPGEFTQRAFLNGRLDLAQAEAVGALIRSKTRLAHRAALEQAGGGLSRRVKSLQALLLDLLATIEAALDHPEDDIPELGPPEVSRRLREITSELTKLSESFRIGRLMVEGIRIASN